jgi:hypothetical protein
MRPVRALVVALGVLVTVFGWLPCEGAAAPILVQNTAVPSSDELEGRDQPVTDEDLRILQRAEKILASPAVWNRHDTRICKRTDKTWSLFCALEKASLDVLGEYRHREVALQEVRFAVEDVTKGIEFEHRLMDYNNLASTKFEDITHVLKVATDRVSARLAAQKLKKYGVHVKMPRAIFR